MNLEGTSNYKKGNLVIDDSINTKITKMDWLFIIGAIIAPMTNLRIWKIGPGELLCFLWAITKFKKLVIERNIVFDFFAVFFSSMLAGTFICLFVAPRESRPPDLITWLYFGIIAFSTYDYFKKKNKEYIIRILKMICYGATFWYFMLYLYSTFVSKRFMYVDLWYHGVRYTGGANNPHQLAGFICALIFFFTAEIIKSHKIIMSILGAAINIFILLKTKSSTGILAVAAGLFVFAVQAILLRVNKRKRKKALLIFILANVVLCIAFFGPLSDFLFDWISEDSNGLGRLKLFSHIGETFISSPILGLGPGWHSLNHMEYHNTYLEILAASGIIGFMAFIFFFRKLIKIVNIDSLYLPLVVSLFTFGLAGFIMRRLNFWILIILVYLISLKEHKKDLEKNRNYNSKQEDNNEKGFYVCQL